MTANLLQNTTEICYKMRQVLYYKMQHLLQIATILLQNGTLITNFYSTLTLIQELIRQVY